MERQERRPSEDELGLPPIAGIIVRGIKIGGEEDLCPVCDKEFEDITTVSGCSVEPGDLDNRHCFFAVDHTELLIIEHDDTGTPDNNMEESEAVEIEIN